MEKRYARKNWNSTSTYVSPDNLNQMEEGIDDCDNAIETLSGKISAVGITDLQTQVNTLNNNFVTKSTSIACTSLTNNINIQKYGKIVCISSPDNKTIAPMLTSDGWIAQCTLPAEYIPSTIFTTYLTTPIGKRYGVFITAGGEFRFIAREDIPTDVSLGFCIVYIAK